MINNLNWDEVDKCQLWRILGVTECDGCNNLVKCWGADAQLPEPKRTPEQQTHWEQTLKTLFNCKER